MSTKTKALGLTAKFTASAGLLAIGYVAFKAQTMMMDGMIEQGNMDGWQLPATAFLVGAFYAGSGALLGRSALKETKDAVYKSLGKSFQIPS